MVATADDAMCPPEVHSGLFYSGDSSSLTEAAAAWQGLAAEYGSAGAAFGAVVTALSSGPWLGPSSISMAASAAPYVVWMLAMAVGSQTAAEQAAAAATLFETARASMVPPPEIEANRNLLLALISTNFMGVNSAAIAATEADYQRMWWQDVSAKYAYNGGAAGVTGVLAGSPFTPALPNTDPAGLAGQAAAVSQAAGQVGPNTAGRLAETGTTLPGGMDPSMFMSMAPQLMSTIPQVLQGFSSPLQSLASPASSLGQFSSLLSPFTSGLANPGVLTGADGVAAAAATPAALGGAGGSAVTGLGTLGGGAGAVASVGRAGGLGGLAVPATWAAGAQPSARATPVSAAAAAPAGAAPVGTSGGGYGGGAAPLAAMAGRDGRSAGGNGPRYGTPVRVLPRKT